MEVIVCSKIFSINKAKTDCNLSSVSNRSIQRAIFRTMHPFWATMNSIPLKPSFISFLSEFRISIVLSTSASVCKIICTRTFCLPRKYTLVYHVMLYFIIFLKIQTDKKKINIYITCLTYYQNNYLFALDFFFFLICTC